MKFCPPVSRVEVRAGWVSDMRRMCLTPDWRSVVRAGQESSRDPLFWGNSVVQLGQRHSQALTVPGFTGNSDKWLLFWLSWSLKCVDCSIWYSELSFWNVYYFCIGETGGSSLLEEHGPIISWREMGNKEKAGPGDPSAQGYSGHCLSPALVSPPCHTMTLLSLPHIFKGRGALLSPGLAWVSERKQGWFLSELTG